MMANLFCRYIIIITILCSVKTIGQNNYYNAGGPTDMIDKSTLKPAPGSFSSDISPLSENLNQGKVNIDIPFFNFEYYDFKMPVSINNNYPQKISQNIEGPTFYTNTRVGGDWTFSIDQFKVSRQVNGNEDENPNNGYFSSFSQSKVNNISSINNSDVVNGLKGTWDPAIDVFHFSTPTVTGSFLLNLKNGTFRNLTDGNFNVKYTRDTNTLTSFTITDDRGTQYFFGGDATSIEITQSKTDIFSMGVDNGLGRLKYIVEFDNYGKFLNGTLLDKNTNLYARYPNLGYSILLPIIKADDIINSIIKPGYVLNSSEGSYMYNLGNNCYGIPADYSETNRNTKLPGETFDDADMRRPKVNSAWYLREIKLINGKKIIFNYQNSWLAYTTRGANKVAIDQSNVDYIYKGAGNTSKVITNLIVYNCMPQTFSILQFPINESYSTTTNFVKTPELIQIHDEDFISTIDIDNGISGSKTLRPYIISPSQYTNAPQETIDAANREPALIKKITFNKNNKIFKVDLTNTTTLSTINGSRSPWYDYSTLNEVIINGSKKYSFTYLGKNISKIKYPTGATKQFYSSEVKGTAVDFSLLGTVILQSGKMTDSIVTVSENNRTTEKYIYTSPRFYMPNYVTYKTFRPDVFTCTSLAKFSSTSSIFNNIVTRSGLYFLNAKKYINNDLRISSDLSEGVSVANTLYMTDGTPTSNYITGPATCYEQSSYIPKKTTQFKKTLANQVVKQQTSDLTYNFTSPILEFPSIYLANIEAGPWSNTSGAIRRGYSKYYLLTGLESNIITVTDSLFLDNNKFIKTINTSFFERYRHVLGTNTKKLNLTRTYDSQGNSWETAYMDVNSAYRNPLIGGFEYMDSPLFQSMRKNNISPNLFKIEYKNNNMIGIDAYKYKLLLINSGVPVLDSQKSIEPNEVNLSNISLFSSNPSDASNFIYNPRFKDKIIYDRYDNNGRLIEYHIPEGAHTSIIWGYKGQYPIAKIENSNYSDVEPYVANLQSLSNLDMDNCILPHCNEQILLESLNNLRNIQNLSEKWFVTTYTYDYNTGLTSSTDAKGLTTYYEYDNANKLKFIKDQDSNVLQRYCYNYKGQVIDCSQIVQVLTVPTGLALSSASSSTLNFSWTPVFGAIGYKIYKNGVYVSSTTATSGSLSGLATSSTYGVQVLAYNGAGDGVLCTSVSMTTTIAYTYMGSIINKTGHTISAGTMQILANGNYMCSISMPSLAAGATFNFSTGYSSPAFSNSTFVLKLYSTTVGIDGTNYFNMTAGSSTTNGFFSNQGWGWQATVTSTGPQYVLGLYIY